MELPENYRYGDGTLPDHFIHDDRHYEVHSNVLAGKWRAVTQNFLDARQQQFHDLGLSDEEIELRLGNHIAYMDMLWENADNENFIDLLSGLEKAALEHSENGAGYGLHHILQLDALVDQVIQLQEELAANGYHSLPQ